MLTESKWLGGTSCLLERRDWIAAARRSPVLQRFRDSLARHVSALTFYLSACAWSSSFSSPASFSSLQASACLYLIDQGELRALETLVIYGS